MWRKVISMMLVLSLFFTSFSFAENKLNLTGKAAYLIEAETGETLYSYNEHEVLRPASVTKVMTLLLIMEALEDGSISLDDLVPCSERARKMGGSQIWLNENEKLTVNDMLKAICVVSANDCCVAMSEFLGGSEEVFVEMMNQRAKELGMKDTTFKNCHGIDEEGHVTSAYDIAIMSRELIKHKKIFDYTTIWMDSLRDGKSQLVNTNRLIRFYDGANGLKTGSTSLALYNLSATAKRDNMQLVGVILGAPTTKDRFNDATKLLDYGFANYAVTMLDEKGTEVGDTKVERGEEDFVTGVIAEDVSKLTEKKGLKGVERQVNFMRLKAPVKAGEQIGEMVYLKDGAEIAKVAICAKYDVDKLSFPKSFMKIFNGWFRMGRETV
ncbi:MAG: D-alanyl-D-alanine carboxypeptidase [Clostridia bacterium]|nr:D-alanyl-D-alanine carboxypeptidase [Clostridia bacterium]